jgi:hypothetical protein
VETLKVYNAANLVCGRFRDRLLNVRSNAVHDVLEYLGDPDKCSPKRLEKLGKALSDAFPQMNGKECIKKIQETFKGHHLAKRSIADLIGSEVLRLNQNPNSPVLVEYLGLLWILYKRCFDIHPPDGSVSKRNEHDGICAGLFPSFNRKHSFNFEKVVDHFGVFVIHPLKHFSKNLLKISCFHGNGRKENPKLDPLLHSWARRIDSNEYEKIADGRDAKTTPILQVFQRIISDALTYRQNAFLANSGAEVPLILIIENEEVIRDTPSNVICFQDKRLLTALCEKYVRYRMLVSELKLSPDETVLITCLMEKLTRFQKEHGEKDVITSNKEYFNGISSHDPLDEARAANLIEFFLPLVFFGNPIVITGQHNPRAIPFLFSFNFSIDLGVDAKTADLARWSSICSVGMRTFLAETAAVLNDAAIEIVSREEGAGIGALRSAHDYSKDLNLLDSRLARFSTDLQGLRQAVRDFGGQTVDEFRKEVASKVDGLRFPEEQWLLEARFLMAHQRALTESRLYEQPEWCLELIKRGTRGALYRLLKVLVWFPITWREHADATSLSKADESREQALDGEGLSDWARLFAYDERGRHPEIDKQLGAYMHHLYVVERISEKRFWQLHPPPQLNPKEPMTAQLLWEELDLAGAERWRPVGTLCPLLVFSLRAAFQHAWLTSFLLAARYREEFGSMKDYPPPTDGHNVSLESIGSGMGMELRFPNPNPGITYSSDQSPTRLPWGNWEREISRYSDRGLCYPWRVSPSYRKATNEFHIRIQSQKPF